MSDVAGRPTEIPDVMDTVAKGRATADPAVRLWCAADVLANPYRCNQSRWDDAVEALLRDASVRHEWEVGSDEDGPVHASAVPGCCGMAVRPLGFDGARCTCFDHPLAIAAAILDLPREDSPPCS